jgi:hypothetical protein
MQAVLWCECGVDWSGSGAHALPPRLPPLASRASWCGRRCLADAVPRTCLLGLLPCHCYVLVAQPCLIPTDDILQLEKVNDRVERSSGLELLFATGLVSVHKPAMVLLPW